MKVGNIVEKIINILSLGQGHKIAQYIAIKLGFPDCGCEKRKDWLNQLFTKQKDINLK